MYFHSEISLNQLRDYSSLFSRNVVSSCMKNDFESIEIKIRRYDKKWFNSDSATYMDYLKYVYRVLESNYQNEYIFKNSFLNECLIKDVNTGESKVFSEFRVGDAVADLALFNGTSKVFEIKTEMDSAKRLDFQLKNYRKAFNEIYLVLPKSRLAYYESFGEDIGIYVYLPSSKNKFQLHRPCIPNTSLDKNTIMKVLHTPEYKELVRKHYGYLPKMTSFNQFRKCRDLILQIPNDELNSYFIAIMKLRQKAIALTKKHHREFNQMSLALKMSKTERRTLITQLKSPIRHNHVLSTT